MYPSWAVPHTGLQNTEPNRRGSFLNITIISLYCNARTDWLSPGGNQYWLPWVIREVGSRTGDYIHTNTYTPTHTHTQSFLHKSSFANNYTSSNPRLFCLIWLTTVIEGLSPFPSVFKVNLGKALVLTAVWELREEWTELHEGFWGLTRERRIKHWWYKRPWGSW